MRLLTLRRRRASLVSPWALGLVAAALPAALPAAPAFSQSKTAPAAPKVASAPSAPASAARARTVVISDFPLAAGDILDVVVANHPEMSGQLVVTEAGKVSLPIIGNLSVAGKTIAQAEKQIFAAVDTQISNPQVTVSLSRSRPRQVRIIGAVRTPGALDLSATWRVSEAIDAAGGLINEPEDVVATLVRGKAQPVRLNIAEIVASPRDAANVPLKPGDVLRFSVVPGLAVRVAGDVKAPAAYTLRRGSRLLDALLAAGDLSQKAETSRISLVRAGQETVLEAAEAVSQPTSAANVPLRNGDLLRVQAVRTAVSVVAFGNQVKTSGPLTLDGQAHVLQAVFAAGLAVAPAQVNVAIQRGSEKIPIDLERAAYDPKADVPLQNGDLLLFTAPPGPTVQVPSGVNKPGTLHLKENATLLDAIFTAGNLSAKPDEVKINILRQNGDRASILSVDPVSLLSLRDLSQNVRLKDGDSVIINPVQVNTVFVTGEVAVPSAYQIGENDGLVELLLRAGNATSFAALKQVQIKHRDGTSVAVDLSQINKPGAARISIPLQPGDLINVPRNTNQVLVMNAVQKPGYYPIPENGSLTIGNVLLMAGIGNRAKLQNVAIVRRGPNGEMNSQIVPVNQLANNKTTGGNLPMNVALQPGDIIYVPEISTKPSAVSTALSSLGSLSILRQLFAY